MTKDNTYVRPADVHAPKRYWSLVQVLFDGGEGDSSLAIGRWENNPVLAMRWNGTTESPLGNPQSRGLPTWFIVPEQHRKQILETEQYSLSDQRSFLREIFWSLSAYIFCLLAPTLHARTTKSSPCIHFGPMNLKKPCKKSSTMNSSCTTSFAMGSG